MKDPFRLAIELAKQAGETLLDYQLTASLNPAIKPDRSLVTEADVAVDQMLTHAILADNSQAIIISEELHPFTGNFGASNPIWIIDPVDGTTNYALGIHYWGILITQLFLGEPQFTVHYFPLIDEMYTAQKGQGAYLNGTLIRVEQETPKNQMTFFSCCSRTHKQYQVNIPYKTRIFGSTAYSLCCLARGTARIAFEAQAKIWDLAGGWLLIQEAGGIINTHHGESPFPIQQGVDYSNKNFAVLAASNGLYFANAQKQLIEKQFTT